MLTALPVLTQQLVDEPLITEILGDVLVGQRRHGSQHPDAVAHLSLLTASPSSPMEAVALAKVRICNTRQRQGGDVENAGTDHRLTGLSRMNFTLHLVVS